MLFIILLGVSISSYALYTNTIDGIWERVTFAGGLAFIVLGVTYIEQHNYNLKWPNILLLIGNASYSIYLIHNPLLSITQRLLAKISGIDWLLASIIGVLSSIIVGLIYYYSIEKPAIVYSKKLIQRF